MGLHKAQNVSAQEPAAVPVRSWCTQPSLAVGCIAGTQCTQRCTARRTANAPQHGPMTWLTAWPTAQPAQQSLGMPPCAARVPTKPPLMRSPVPCCPPVRDGGRQAVAPKGTQQALDALLELAGVTWVAVMGAMRIGTVNQQAGSGMLCWSCVLQGLSAAARAVQVTARTAWRSLVSS